MRRRFLAVINVFILVCAMSISVYASSPEAGKLDTHDDDVVVEETQPMADIDYVPALQSEELLAADAEVLPSVEGDMFIAPDTGDSTSEYSIIILAGIVGVIAFSYKKNKRA